MQRATIVIVSGLLLCSPMFAADKATLTGWFSDQQCATARAKSGSFTPTNPDCALDCIRKGAKMAFISEKDKAVYVVANPAMGEDHFAEHVEVSGAVDPKTRVLQITSVKDLGDYIGPACTRPRNKK